MDAKKPLYIQARDLRKMWNELFFAMGKGKQTEIDAIKRQSVFEFWANFDLWKAQTSKERERLEAQNRKKH